MSGLCENRCIYGEKLLILPYVFENNPTKFAFFKIYKFICKIYIFDFINFNFILKA